MKKKYIATWGGGLHKLENDTITQLKDFEKDYTKTNKIDFLFEDQIYLIDDRFSFKIFDIAKNKFKKIEVIKDPLGRKNLVIDKRIKRAGVKFNTYETVVDSTVYIHASPIARLHDMDFRGLYKVNQLKLHSVSKQLESMKIHAVTKHKDTFITASHYKIQKIHKGTIVKEFIIESLKEKKVLDLKYIDGVLYFISIDKNAKREIHAYYGKGNVLNFSKLLNIKSLVSDFLIDKDSNLWITTYGDGVYQLPKLPFKFYNESFFEETDFKDIQFYKEKKYILSTNSVYQFYKGEVEKRAELGFHEERLYLNKNQLEIQTMKTPKKWCNKNLDIPIVTKRYYTKQINKKVKIDVYDILIGKEKVKRKNSPITKYLIKDSIFYISYARRWFAVL